MNKNQKIMSKELTYLKADIGDIYRNYYLPVIYKEIDTQVEFATKIESSISNFISGVERANSPDELLGNYAIFHADLYDTIQNIYNSEKRTLFNEEFHLFSENFNNYLNTINESISQVQSEDRFTRLKEDKFNIRIIKRIKRILRFIGRIPRFSTNLFRKIIRKPIKPYKDWIHTFPARRMALHYFGTKLLELQLPAIKELKEDISKGSLAIWNAVNPLSILLLKGWEQLLPEAVKKEIDKIEIVNLIRNHIDNLQSLKSELESGFLKHSENLFDSFFKSSLKTGTLERPTYKYRKSKLNSEYEDFIKKFTALSSGWRNNHFAIFDRWRLSEDIISICITLQNDYLNISNHVMKKFIAEVDVRLNKISNRIEKAREKISVSELTPNELKKTIAFEKEYLFDELSNARIPELTDFIIEENIPLFVDDIENSFREKIKNLTHERAVVKADKYEGMIKKSDIDYIQSQEIVNFDILPQFLNSSRRIKNELTEMISTLMGKINLIEQVTDFNLESALAMLTKSEEKVSESINIAIDGLDRSSQRIAEIRELTEQLANKTLKGLLDNINISIEEMIELTKTEKLLQQKLIITKSKAIEKTKATRRSILLFIKDIFPLFVLLIKKGLTNIKARYSDLSKMFGLSKDTVTITSEISDFLAETFKAIDKLPYIYQRLYRTEALYEERFFVSREEEFERIREAMSNWEIEKFAPLAIVGEKGSGVTSLINIYMKNYNTGYKMHRSELKRPMDKERFLGILMDMFNCRDIKSFEELKEDIIKSEKKTIIVLEGIHSLMIRTVGGFELLKELFGLISATNEKVFWICTCGEYAWKYMDKTIKISDYFAYNILLGQLSNRQIVDIILKRHSVSGFNLEYLPSKADKENKKFQGLNTDEKQAYLEKEYFQDLNRFSKSNISIALYFWIRSTADIDNNKIMIKSLKDYDFSFMATMEIKKIFTMQALLLHDGMTPEEHALVFKQNPNASREILMVMHDDGIIVKNAGIYKINPLLYRQTVNMLKSRNLIS